MLSEKMMEDAICDDPENYLKEKGLKHIARQPGIGKYRFDILFEDRHGEKLIVEIQKGILDREHYLKILDYYLEYKERNPKEYTHLMVVANKIPYEKRKKMSSLGISFKEIPEEDFIVTENNEQREPYKNFIGRITLNENIADNSIVTGQNLGKTIILDQPKMKSPEAIVVDKFNTIELKTAKGIFQNVFNRCNEYLQNLFLKLAKDISESFSVEHYPTDKPDYRFRKRNIFCELVLKPSKGCLQVFLRVDSYHIDSQNLSLKEVPPSKMKGTKWVQLEINDGSQLNETLILIKQVYEFSD